MDDTLQYDPKLIEPDTLTGEPGDTVPEFSGDITVREMPLTAEEIRRGYERMFAEYKEAGGMLKSLPKLKRVKPNNSGKEHRRWRARNVQARESRRRNRQR